MFDVKQLMTLHRSPQIELESVLPQFPLTYPFFNLDTLMAFCDIVLLEQPTKRGFTLVKVKGQARDK